MISLGLTVMVGAGLSYYFYRLNLIMITNESEFPIESMVVKAAGKLVWRGDIGAFEKLKVRFIAKQGDGVQIIGQWQGQEIAFNQFDRTKTSMGRKIDIVLSETGQFRYFDVH